MQKKLIALAIAGFASTAAMAQVTVYGVMDGSIDMVQVSGSTTPGNDVGNFSRVSANSSLLGFKGSEDLGGGATAVFQIESSIGFDATGGTLAARDSYVGVKSGMGTILLGNLTGPTRALGAGMDVNSGATGIGANAALIGKSLQGHGTNDANSNITVAAACTTRSATCASIFDNRWKNTVAYVSPALGPVTFTGAIVADENKTSDGTAAATAVDTKGYDMGVRFEQGALMVGLTRNWAELDNQGQNETAVTRLAAKYNFGAFDLRVLYDMVTLEGNTLAAAATRDVERNIYGIGGTFTLGSGKFVAQYYKADELEDAVTPTNNANSGAELITLGYEHKLSPRTLVKALYSQVENDSAANFDFGVNATGVAAAGSKVSGFSFGVRHSF